MIVTDLGSSISQADREEIVAHSCAARWTVTAATAHFIATLTANTSTFAIRVAEGVNGQLYMIFSRSYNLQGRNRNKLVISCLSEIFYDVALASCTS